MAIISLNGISIAFGGPDILDNLDLQIEKNQRVCLLGRNGAGKSTLMKIMAGTVLPDSGTVQREEGLKVSYFSQNIPEDLEGPVFDIIAKGLGERGELLLRYRREEACPSSDGEILNSLHAELDASEGWSAIGEVEKIISLMSIDKEWNYRELSGGQKRRVLLAEALVSEPDLLLLDEPTNHLDMETISWMEDFLIRIGVTLVFVTHDRMLLKRLATRIVELDRGRAVDWSCDYATFLERKNAFLDAEEKEWARFDKKLAQEEIWIRQGIKARRTRNEGRVRALVRLREERRQRRDREEVASIRLSEAERSGRLVTEAKGVFYDYGGEPLISDFSAVIARGDKIGIIGANGCGKTTLVSILLGEIAPHKGRVRQGANLSVTYYDQLREELDEEKTVRENVLPDGEFVTVEGKNRHIIGYLQDFLFTPERANTPVAHLSGGERNRLLLARLFTRPSNFLVLDEPTNDLDMETLELFEELLVNFKGTVILISHDRAFLNNVVGSTLVFSGKGKVEEFVGGYDDWMEQREETKKEKADRPDRKRLYREEKRSNRKRKLTFKEARELKVLPERIEAMEEEQKTLYEKMSDPDFFRNKEDVVTAKGRLSELEEELVAAYGRWEELEAIEP